MTAILLFQASLLFAAEPKPDDTHLQCGLHCLFVGMVALDVEAKLDDVEGKLGPPQAGGYSLADLKRVAKGYGLKTAAVRTSAENLSRRNERFACMAHVKGHHFVMLMNVDLDKGLFIRWVVGFRVSRLAGGGIFADGNIFVEPRGFFLTTWGG
jgi:ABC-type bacteriocin/lantibiotic exporter with double-glycine peptidase domain